jgi:hypothetical protein
MFLDTGIHLVSPAVYSCRSCGHQHAQGVEDFLEVGAWPAAPALDDPKALRMVFDETLFMRWRAIHLNTPGISVESFLRAVEMETVEYGGHEYAPEYTSDQVTLFRRKILSNQ